MSAGALALVWVVVVWRWEDPFTGAYTWWVQRHLSAELTQRMQQFALPRPEHALSVAAAEREVAAAAETYRRALHDGNPIGRITIPRIGLSIVVVQGTDESSLTKGPGHYDGSALPGEHRLIYIAGHRTTYLAPFSHIDAIRAGDRVTMQLPYATFTYVVSFHRIVPADDLAVLRSSSHEVLVLQACHPRFFATHRYLVYARPVLMTLKGGRTYKIAASASA